MKRFGIVFAILFSLLSVSAHAQNAKVIALDKTDADRGTKLYQAKIDADNAWDAYQRNVVQKYTLAKESTPKYPIYVEGRDGLVEFSKDFHYIVPQHPFPNVWYGNASCGVTPAVGTYLGPIVN